MNGWVVLAAAVVGYMMYKTVRIDRDNWRFDALAAREDLTDTKSQLSQARQELQEKTQENLTLKSKLKLGEKES